MSKVRLGVVGTGLAFEDLHLPVLLEMREQFEIVALCNRTPDRARGLAARIATQTGNTPDIYSDVTEMLAHTPMDAVDVAVPINVTAQVATEALKHGMHVFAEKPIADSVADGQALINTAREAGKVLAVGEHFRFMRKYHQVKELAASGIIGDTLVYRLNDMHYTNPGDKFPSTQWRREGNFTGGYLIDGGVHTVAAMRVMVGSPVLEVHAMTASFNPAMLSNQQDTLLLHLKFANGMLGQVALGCGATDREARRPKVYGREGTLVLFGDHIEVWRPDKDEPAQIIAFEGDNSGFRAEWLDFYNAVSTGRALAFPPEEALADLQIIMAGLESARSGQVVKLAPQDGAKNAHEL